MKKIPIPYKEQYEDIVYNTKETVDDIKHLKKLNGAIDIFVLLVAIIFDIFSLVPGLSTIIFILFVIVIKAQLWFAGYKAGVRRTVVSFFLNFLVDGLFSIWFACTFFTLTFYYFNNRLYKMQQKKLKENYE